MPVSKSKRIPKNNKQICLLLYLEMIIKSWNFDFRRCYGNFFCCDDQKIHRSDSIDHEEVDIPLKTNYLGRKGLN
jgi:hypothetical protein